MQESKRKSQKFSPCNKWPKIYHVYRFRFTHHNASTSTSYCSEARPEIGPEDHLIGDVKLVCVKHFSSKYPLAGCCLSAITIKPFRLHPVGHPISPCINTPVEKQYI